MLNLQIHCNRTVFQYFSIRDTSYHESGAVEMASPECDVLIRGGTVIDGTGAPSFRADVAIDGSTIVAVGPELPHRPRSSLVRTSPASSSSFGDPPTR